MAIIASKNIALPTVKAAEREHEQDEQLLFVVYCVIPAQLFGDSPDQNKFLSSPKTTENSKLVQVTARVLEPIAVDEL